MFPRCHSNNFLCSPQLLWSKVGWRWHNGMLLFFTLFFKLWFFISPMIIIGTPPRPEFHVFPEFGNKCPLFWLIVLDVLHFWMINLTYHILCFFWKTNDSNHAQLTFNINKLCVIKFFFALANFFCFAKLCFRK